LGALSLKGYLRALSLQGSFRGGFGIYFLFFILFYFSGRGGGVE
jgi:hypothetical protein